MTRSPISVFLSGHETVLSTTPAGSFSLSAFPSIRSRSSRPLGRWRNNDVLETTTQGGTETQTQTDAKTQTETGRRDKTTTENKTGTQGETIDLEQTEAKDGTLTTSGSEITTDVRTAATTGSEHNALDETDVVHNAKQIE